MAFGNGRRDPRNMYNGNLSFSLGNSALDARSYSVTGASVAKPAYANGRGDATFGGPLRIPKLVSPQEHIMFTLSYQFQRNRTGTISQPVNMPTDLERAGDFSQTLSRGSAVTIYDPTTGVPFPENKIPSTSISAAAAALLKYYPRPNLPYAARNYQTSWTGRNNSKNVNARLSNIGIGSKDRINFGLGYRGSDSITPNLFQFIDTGSGRGINADLSWSRTIATRLTNSVRYSFSRNRQQSSPYFANRENVAAALGIAGTSQNPLNWGPPNLSFTNYGGLTDGSASLNRNQTSSATENLMWVHGAHTYTFGADYRRQQFNQFADSNGRGSYSFDGSATSYYVNGVAQSGTGYDLADFLLGLPATGSIRYGTPDKYSRGSSYDYFVNGDWRIAPRFSIVMGVRWDYATPVTELYNRLVNLDVAPGFAAIAAVQAGPQRNHGEHFLPVLEIHRQCGNGRTRTGQYARGAELAGPLRRTGAFQLRRPAQPLGAIPVQQRDGPRGRHAGERLEGRPDEGLDRQRGHQPSLGHAADGDGRRESFAGFRNGGKQHRAGGRHGPVGRSPGYVVQHRGVRRPGGWTVGECGEEHDPRTGHFFVERPSCRSPSRYQGPISS
jgi:hypothetical protein